MEFKINVELSASPALLEAVLALAAAFQQTALYPVPQTEKAKPARGKAAELAKPIIAPEKIEPVAEVATEVVETVVETATETAVETSTEDTTITLEDLRGLVREKAQAGHREKIKAFLTEAEADNVTALAKEKYAAFKSKVEAL